ncbi:protein strawberry notch [Cucumis melo var. makuwa]|uniref:Protein strawberry notch n=1 Tax=Cucumis melo var. makuwa TaxID=1194695 RepID=A0A5D3B6Z1_CUCMM|nr:protein strawberry notch [Cucumis melo var. makuwa]
MGKFAGTSQPPDPTVNHNGPKPLSTLGVIAQLGLKLGEDVWHCPTYHINQDMTNPIDSCVDSKMSENDMSDIAVLEDVEVKDSVDEIEVLVMEEMRAFEKNKTWEICTLPNGHKTVGCKLVFTLKYKADGTLKIYKASPKGTVKGTLFMKVSKAGKIAVLVVYVVDIVLFGDDAVGTIQLKKKMSDGFEIKELGNKKYFLSMEVVRSKEGISKEVYLDLLIETGDKVLIDKEKYQCLVGKLIYLSHTRSDIFYALGGPDKVAEITGRRGMLVRAPNGKGVTYQPRNSKDVTMEMVNMHEKQMFMDGKKFVAIISEAGSAGVSLQADRRAANQKRRVHFTLELPWSADRAIQQFGRTHRSNQTSAPEYRAGLSLSAYNYDSAYGKTALTMMYRGIMEQDALPVEPPGCSSEKPETIRDFIENAKAALNSVGIIRDTVLATGKDFGKSSGRIVESDMNDIGRFLNRLLGLPPDIQNRIFELFVSILDLLIQKARIEGNLDSGIVDMRANVVELRGSPKTVHVDPVSGASTMLFTFSLDRGVTWEKIKENDKLIDILWHRIVESMYGIHPFEWSTKGVIGTYRCMISELLVKSDNSVSSFGFRHNLTNRKRTKVASLLSLIKDFSLREGRLVGRRSFLVCGGGLLLLGLSAACFVEGRRKTLITSFGIAIMRAPCGVCYCWSLVLAMSVRESASTILDEKQKDGLGSTNDGFYESRRDWLGRCHIILAFESSVSGMYKIVRPAIGESLREMSLSELRNKYRKTSSLEKARNGWEDEYDISSKQCMHGPKCKLGNFCTVGRRIQEVNVLGGLILPVWGTIENALSKQARQSHQRLRVVRIETTTDKQRIVGLFVPNAAVESVLQGLAWVQDVDD